LSEPSTSGLYYPNRIVRTYLEALQDILGSNGMRVLLKHAGLARWIESPPPDNLAKEVDFADFSRLCAVLDDFYGLRGGHGVARRASWASYGALRQALADIPEVAHWDEVELPLEKKIKGALVGTSRILSGVSDQYTTVEEDDASFFFSVHQCPVCWGREHETPLCHPILGALEEATRWSSNGLAFQIEEIQCKAMGHEMCQFRVSKAPVEEK
jgi:hypothetical protein